MKKVVKFESKPKAEKKGFVVKTAVKAGMSKEVYDERRRNMLFGNR